MSNLCLDCEKGREINVWLFFNISNDERLRRYEWKSGGKDRVFIELDNINANKIRLIRKLTLLIK